MVLLQFVYWNIHTNYTRGRSHGFKTVWWPSVTLTSTSPPPHTHTHPTHTPHTHTHPHPILHQYITNSFCFVFPIWLPPQPRISYACLIFLSLTPPLRSAYCHHLFGILPLLGILSISFSTCPPPPGLLYLASSQQFSSATALLYVKHVGPFSRGIISVS